jgi:hypothetical protein
LANYLFLKSICFRIGDLNQMSKKTLLNESQIRRFMKLADMQPLAQPFVRGSAHVLREQGVPPAEDELDDPVEDDPMADMPGEAEDDMGMPADEGPGPAGVDIEGLVGAIADAIEAETGVQIDVEGEGGEDDMGMPPDDMGPEDDMGMAEDPLAPGPEGPAADMGRGGVGGPPMPPGKRGMYQESRRRRAAAIQRRRAALQETRMRQYIRREAMKLLEDAGLIQAQRTVLEGEHSDFSGAGLADQGSNSDRSFESDDNRQSSAGEHHTGGGKAKVSKQHMGGNTAALPLEEAKLEQLTRRVAARLLDKSKK